MSINLSDRSIAELQDLCRVVAHRNPKNEISVNMSKGIAEYIALHKSVTEPQAQWLSRNADYYKIPRPAELANLIIQKKTASENGEIIQSLRRIEKLLADFLTRSTENQNWNI